MHLSLMLIACWLAKSKHGLSKRVLPKAAMLHLLACAKACTGELLQEVRHWWRVCAPKWHDTAAGCATCPLLLVATLLLLPFCHATPVAHNVPATPSL